jgi:hypothetical protein
VYEISVNVCAALKCCQYKGGYMCAVSIIWMAVNSFIVLFFSFWKDGQLPHIVATAVHKLVAMIVTMVTTAVSDVPGTAADMFYVSVITPVLAHFLTH